MHSIALACGDDGLWLATTEWTANTLTDIGAWRPSTIRRNSARLLSQTQRSS